MAFNFGAPAKPTLNLGFNNNNNNGVGTASLFGQPVQNNNNQQQQQQSNAQSTNIQSTNTTTPQIDLTHLRSTTKYDHLQPELQNEILALDTAILNQIQQCSEVANLLPTVAEAGKQLAPAIEYIDGKVEELELGLENDAEAIVGLRDGEIKQDEGEVKCVFRNIDRLKMPRQYQIGHTMEVGVNGTVPYGSGSGLTGWWNHPQTLRGSTRGGAGGQSVQLVDEEIDENETGPKSLVEIFDRRTASFESVTAQHKQLLSEIEDFVEGLEEKVIGKERDLNERLNYGNSAQNSVEEEKERQMQLLRFVFGEVQRGLYEAADKISTTRDGVSDLGMTR